MDAVGEVDEQQDQALDALLAVMFTQRSRTSVSAQSRQSSVGGGDDGCDLDSDREASADGDGKLRGYHQAEARTSKAPMPAIKRPGLSEHQIVTFDVGGQVFRCRAGLVLQFPKKRLAQLITCGCARVQDNSETSFFIDRNPTHFQRILDWYRCPVDAAAAASLAIYKDRSFQEDARYFDLYDEFFPPVVVKPNALPVPPRPLRHQIEAALARAPPAASRQSLQRPKSLQQLSTTYYPVSKPVQERLRPSKGPICQEAEHTNKILRFVKREYRTLVSGSTPCIYAVRKGEELHVARVKGSGRLLLRVCDATGMKQLHVAQAVLFDSQACFYNQDEWIPLGCQGQLPGNRTYTFWAESLDLEPSESKSNSNTMMMQVEFKLISSFHWNQRADIDMQSRGSIPNAPAASAPLDPSAILSPSLMLPPQQQQLHQGISYEPRQDSPEKQSQTVSARAKLMVFSLVNGLLCLAEPARSSNSQLFHE